MWNVVDYKDALFITKSSRVLTKWSHKSVCPHCMSNASIQPRIICFYPYRRHYTLFFTLKCYILHALCPQQWRQVPTDWACYHFYVPTTRVIKAQKNSGILRGSHRLLAVWNSKLSQQMNTNRSGFIGWCWNFAYALCMDIYGVICSINIFFKVTF